jgi:hypothetical protein
MRHGRTVHESRLDFQFGGTMQLRHGVSGGLGALAVAVLMLGQGARSLAAQSPAASAPPAAAPADVSTVPALVRAIYDAISGPAGQTRDYDRFRSLFAPEARLLQVVHKPDGSRSLSMWTIEEFVAAQGPQLDKMDFYEREVANRTDQFGDIAHVLSTFESRKSSSDPKTLERGVNSMQLRHDGKRWWCVSVLWTDERADLPLPPRYLKSPRTTD